MNKSKDNNANYKKILASLDNSFSSIDDVVRFYTNSGLNIQIKDDTEKYYSIIFNRDMSSPIIIPKITEEIILNSADYYLDDDDIILDINKMSMLVYIDRFNFFNKKMKEGIKMPYSAYLKRDIEGIVNNISYVNPYSINNLIKIQNRIRVVKTWFVKKKNKEYYPCIGQALWDNHIPNSENDIKKYSKMFSDFISVNQPSKGMYVSCRGDDYTGTGYSCDTDSITTIFKTKANIPERGRQHYTSNALEPINKDIDVLMPDKPLETVSAVCVFVPINNDEQYKDIPLKKGSLVGGDILVSRKFAESQYNVERTFYISENNSNVVSEGEILNPGDALSYNIEGYPDIIYDLNYRDAIVKSVENMPMGCKVTLETLSNLSVGRVISDTGLKGVTHPRDDVGTITVDNKTMDVDMIVGPNSIKSGSNGIRLGWLALKKNMEGKTLSSNLNKDNYSEEYINEHTSDLKKIDWTYRGKTVKVYAGVLNVTLTDLAKDCRIDNIRIMPETLKYMYFSNDSNMHRIANLLLDNFVDDVDRWTVKELLELMSMSKPNNNLPIWDYKDLELRQYLKKQYIIVSNTISTSHNVRLPILLNPLNKGFYIKVEDKYIKMPSVKLLNKQSNNINGNIVYPKYVVYCLYIILSVKNMSSDKMVMKNVENYHYAVSDELWPKQKAVSRAVSPRVVGGHLKQLSSVYVPSGVSVVVDGELESKILTFKKEYKKYQVKTLLRVISLIFSIDQKSNVIPFCLYILENISSRKYMPQVIEIGVRNPVIWSFQFRPKIVWNVSKFKKHLKKYNLEMDDVLIESMSKGSVIRSIPDMLLDQSDNDGDLYPISIPFDYEIQTLLFDSYIDGFGKSLESYESEWSEEYSKGEADNSKIEDIENKPFKYYTISREWFSNALSSSAIAKQKVGVGTVDMWKFHALSEKMYLLGKISKEEAKYMMFLFSRIVQDYIVRGIKHVDNGSSSYDDFALYNVKADRVYKSMTNFMGIDEENANLFARMSEIASKDKDSATLSKILNGGNKKVIQKYAKTLSMINGDIKENMSYGKIIKDLIPSIEQFIN